MNILVGIATSLTFRGSKPGIGKIFFSCPNQSKSTLGPTRFCGYLLPGVNRLGREINHFFLLASWGFRDKWVPVTTAWCFLSLRMEEMPPIWRVAANVLNKESPTGDKCSPAAWGWARC